MTRPDLVPVLLDVTIDPCDGSVAPSLQYILIRGFTAMGWEQPKAASEDIAMAILEMIRPSSKPHPMDEGLRRTQAIMSAGSVQTIKWLRELAVKGGRGIVNNIDARCLGRIADEIERLTALNNKLTEDFNTLALDRSRWQGLAKDALDLGKSTAKKLQDAQDALASLRSMLELGPSALPVRGSLPSGESDLPVT